MESVWNCAVWKTWLIVKWGANLHSQVLACNNTLFQTHFSVRVFKICLWSLRRPLGREEQVGKRPGVSGKGGEVSPRCHKCVAGAAGRLALGVGQGFSLLAHSGAAQAWQRPTSLKLGQESEQFPTSPALPLCLLHKLLDLGFPGSLKPGKQCGSFAFLLENRERLP